MVDEILKYPEGIEGIPFENSIMFFINEARGNTELEETSTNGISLSDELEEFANFDMGNDIEIFDSAASSFTRFDKTIVNEKAIQLYIPNSIEFQSGFGWSREELGGAASMALLMGSIGQQTGAAGNDLESTLETLGSDATSRRINNEIRDNLVEVAGSIGEAFGFEGQGVGERISRRTQNDHQEVLFKNVNGREFQFNFHFLPRSRNETKIVRDIIYAFRYYAHPSVSDEMDEDGLRTIARETDMSEEEIMENYSDSYGRWINYPAQFQPVFLYKSQDGWRVNRTIPRIGQCALTDISMVYGPNEFSTFDDDLNGFGTHPTEVKLSLTFMELQVLNRERIRQGF